MIYEYMFPGYVFDSNLNSVLPEMAAYEVWYSRASQQMASNGEVGAKF